MCFTRLGLAVSGYRLREGRRKKSAFGFGQAETVSRFLERALRQPKEPTPVRPDAKSVVLPGSGTAAISEISVSVAQKNADPFLILAGVRLGQKA